MCKQRLIGYRDCEHHFLSERRECGKESCNNRSPQYTIDPQGRWKSGGPSWDTFVHEGKCYNCRNQGGDMDATRLKTPKWTKWIKPQSPEPQSPSPVPSTPPPPPATSSSTSATPSARSPSPAPSYPGHPPPAYTPHDPLRPRPETPTVIMSMPWTPFQGLGYGDVVPGPPSAYVPRPVVVPQPRYPNRQTALGSHPVVQSQYVQTPDGLRVVDANGVPWPVDPRQLAAQQQTPQNSDKKKKGGR